MTPKKRPFTAHTNALMTLQNPFFGEMEGWNANVRICVVGLGYIGLPTASLLAKAGHEVIGVDINEGHLSDTSLLCPPNRVKLSGTSRGE